MPVAAALSEHPVAAVAVGEVVGHVLEVLGERPDLAVVFASASHAGGLEDVARAISSLLSPQALAGCAAAMVAGGRREVEDRPALSLWAATGLEVRAARLTAATPSGHLGEHPVAPGDADAVVLLADPFGFDAEAWLAGLPAGLPAVGGMASAARGPGGSRLVLGDRVYTDGAVAVAVRGEVEALVSQGCRPVGSPMAVTRVEGPLIGELAGRPALERVQEVLRGLAPDDLDLARRGLHLGRVVDEVKEQHGRGDFLVRNVLGADPSTGAVAVDDAVDLGATVQVHLRDAASADEDLRLALAGREAAGALLFTCNGRGTALFGRPDHDASLVGDLLDDPPLAGMSCAGEIGPVGDRSFLHGFTASVLLVRGSTTR